MRIVMLTALIALTLGMTSLPTVLSPKPAPQQYVVVVVAWCSSNYQVSVTGSFYETDKTHDHTLMGWVSPALTCYEADASVPYTGQATSWEDFYVWFLDSAGNPVTSCIFGPDSGTSFPAIITHTCPGYGTTTVTISTPKTFP